MATHIQFGAGRNLPTPPPPRLVYRIQDVVVVTGRGRSSIFEMMNPHSPRFDSTFPRSFPLGGPRSKSRGWLAEDITRWVFSKAAQRR
ncbi:AlpA family phage regulatory protein [Variovorax sp. CF313]|uniref:AlpA family phage regulatory protein n=1 Tax=Variovorax sp. CF313 TaxID=1144315 RepID=UPI0012F78FE1